MKKFCDLSAWNVYMDWQRLSEEFDGVILKIGQGYHLDDMFISHVNNAVKYNMPYGLKNILEVKILSMVYGQILKIERYPHGM